MFVFMSVWSERTVNFINSCCLSILRGNGNFRRSIQQMWDVFYIYSPSVCLFITASIHISILVWVISGIFGEDGSFRVSDTVWEKVQSSLGWFFTTPTKRPYWAHLTLVEELSMSDVAWSSLIWTVLVFNCLHKTDGCWVTYSSIRKRKIWEGEVGRRTALAGGPVD